MGEIISISSVQQFNCRDRNFWAKSLVPVICEAIFRAIPTVEVLMAEAEEKSPAVL